MRHLTFERLTLDRFRSFDEAVTLRFNELGTGLHYLRGINERTPRLDANGAGKSSLWDGLLWVLYGRTAAGLKNTDVVPWNGAKKTRGVVDVRVGKTTHRIVRTANPNALTLDGRDVAQTAIDRVIGFPIGVLVNAVIFPQGRPLFLDLEPRRKLELFDEVLALDRWLKRSARAGKKLASRLKLEVETESAMASVEREQETIEELLHDLQDKSKEWEAERSSQIRAEEERVEQATKRLTKLSRERDDADLLLDSAATDLKFLRTDIAKAEHQFRLYVERVNAAKVNEQVAAKEIKALKAALGMEGTCPTCLQPIRRIGEHITHIKHTLAELGKIRVSDTLVDKLEAARAKVVRLEKAKRAFEDKEDDARLVLDRAGPEVASWQATITAAKRSINTYTETKNPYGDQAIDLRHKLGGLKAELRGHQESLNKIRRKIARAKFWVQGFKEVRLYIINDVLGELQMATNAILDAMGLVDWEVRYDVEKQSKSGDVSRALHVTVLSPDNDKAVRWEVWSGGEAQRLRLAGSLALSEVLLNHAGVMTNLEVLDEPSRGMSRGGISDLCDYLAQRADAQNKTIILTEHHALAVGRFRSTITVVKDKAGSYIATS